jgi:hypothetical protein
MIFKKEDLQMIVWDDHEDYEVVAREFIGTRRWSIDYYLVFKNKAGVYYGVSYSVGATEQQDEHPFDDEDDEVEVGIVEPYEKTVTAYRLKS